MGGWGIQVVGQMDGCGKDVLQISGIYNDKDGTVLEEIRRVLV